MRAFALLLVFALCGPLAIAQDASPPADTTPPPPAETPTEATPAPPTEATPPSPTEATPTPPSEQPPPGTASTPTTEASPDGAPAPSGPPAPDAAPAEPAPQDFTPHGSRFTGGWLSFQYPATGFSVENLTFANETFVENLSVNATTPTPSDGEATYTLDAREATLSLQDAGTATVELAAHAGIRAVLVLAPGLETTQSGANDLHLEATQHALDLHVPDNSTLTWDQTRETVTIEVHEGETLEMRFSNVNGEVAQPASEAFQNGTLGGEVVVDGQRAIAVDHGTTHVTASRTQKEAIVIVSSTMHEARVIVVTLHQDAFEGGNLKVLLDGQAISEAATVREAFDAPNLTRPEYLMVSGSTETQIIVALPHLSTHTIQIQSAATLTRVITDPRAYLVVLAALATTVLLGFPLVWRRGRE